MLIASREINIVCRAVWLRIRLWIGFSCVRIIALYSCRCLRGARRVLRRMATHSLVEKFTRVWCGNNVSPSLKTFRVLDSVCFVIVGSQQAVIHMQTHHMLWLPTDIVLPTLWNPTWNSTHARNYTFTQCCFLAMSWDNMLWYLGPKFNTSCGDNVWSSVECFKRARHCAKWHGVTVSLVSNIGLPTKRTSYIHQSTGVCKFTCRLITLHVVIQRYLCASSWILNTMAQIPVQSCWPSTTVGCGVWKNTRSAPMK